MTDPVAVPPPGPASAQRLRCASLSVLGRYTDASNATFLVHLDDVRATPEVARLDPDVIASLPADDLGVWKPVAGQRELWDFDAASLPHREVAAHLVDQALGTDLVPTTVWRDGPLGPGSLQAWVPHDPGAHLLTWLESREREDTVLARLVVLDLVINNTDRKAGHVLVGPADRPPRIWAIDHGVTFHVQDKVRTVAWQLQGELIPQDLRDAAGGLADSLADDPGWLRAHLADDEITATTRRAREVAGAERFPMLADRRQLPWPVV